MRLKRYVFAFVLALASGNLAAEMNADEAAIAAVNTVWLQHIADHDALACADLYTDDGVILPPGQASGKGHEAVRTIWQGMFDLPGFSLTFETETIVMSAGEDMALDVGTYVLTIGEGSARAVDHGKFVVGWVKRDGEWKVATDIFNSDGS